MSVELSRAPSIYARAIRSLLLIVLFLVASFYIHDFDIAGRGFDVTGLRLIVYHFARIVFTACLAVACYSLGYWILRSLRLHLLLQGRKAFICYFFLGVSIYGILFGILGLFQLIGAPSALLATLPALAFATQPIEILRVKQSISGFLRSVSSSDVNPLMHVVTISAAVLTLISALLFLVTRVLFIPNPDGNIWEHYLHYYRDVLDRGSTLPGMLWHHFYNSKGAGLVFLADSLSDVFSVQLVSTCMVTAAGLIIFDILADHCRDRRWPFLGSIAYFTFLFGDISDGGMFRVHALILGYAAFFFWGWQYLHSSGKRVARPLLISMVASLIYMGYFQPVAVVVFAPVFVLMAAVRRIVGCRCEFRLAILFGLIVTCGTAFTIMINWVLTGLLELTPIRILWAIADKEKVRQVLGLGGVDFFLAVNNDLVDGDNFLQRISSTIHHPRLFNSVTLLASLLLAALVIPRIARGERVEGRQLLFAEVVMFVAPLTLLTIFFPSPSVGRMGIYSVVFVVLGMVLVWEQVVELVFGELSIALHRPTTSETIYISLRQAAIFVVVGLGSFWIVATEICRMGPVDQAIYRFDQATASLRGAMERMEEDVLQIVSATTMKSVSEFRTASGYNGALLGLTFDPSYAYFIPGKGFISEPTYAFVKDPERLLEGDADVVAAYLSERKIEYVALNLSSRLFSTVAFTSLFDVRTIQKYFDVAYEDGDFFVLRLHKKTEESASVLPEYLLTRLELKRSGILNFPFTAKFGAALDPGKEIVRTSVEFERSRFRFVQSMQRVLRENMIDQVVAPSTKAWLDDLVAAVGEALLKPDVKASSDRQQNQYVNLGLNVNEEKLWNRWTILVKNELRAQYITALGASLADLEERCDERFPFQIDRPTIAACR